MRIDTEELEGEPQSYELAKAEVEHLECMQPENIYRIEEVEDE